MIQKQLHRKHIPRPSAVAFTRSGDEAPLERKYSSGCLSRSGSVSGLVLRRRRRVITCFYFSNKLSFITLWNKSDIWVVTFTVDRVFVAISARLHQLDGVSILGIRRNIWQPTGMFYLHVEQIDLGFYFLCFYLFLFVFFPFNFFVCM
jgi:hypothetical protein